MSENALSRRRVVTTAATAAWAAPVIVAASAAPSYAGSPGAPAVSTSGLTLSEASATKRDASMTFTNNGNAAATLLTVVIDIQIFTGAYDNQITELTSGWTVSGPVSGPLYSRYFTFTRAGGIGIGAANAQPLAFRFGSFSNGAGMMVVQPPTTTPAGANSGAQAPFGVPG